VAQLTFANIPGFADLDPNTFSPTAPVTDVAMKQLNENAKGGCVRPEEIYMGWFKNGDVVPLPVSPVDGYIYSRTEVRYQIVAETTQPPGAGFVSGQKLRPAAGSASGTAINGHSADVDDQTGTVAINTFYNSGGSTTDGMVKVVAVCTRLSVNLDGGTN
jgi:hypothetical protein